ncbi:MAG: 50S ribosomal protein L23 [Candidatus Omnitrophota bacterium]|nr:MAG: 50S ribosomal protein L23 [Candidatus Omnitrophota bacterium]
MRIPYDSVISLLRTEKASDLLPLNKYLFLVNKKANKFQIKAAVEQIYKVKVDKVNTAVVSGKTKRVRYKTGKTSDWKKALVTLKEGHKIEVT